ncbi:MAG: ABC transporter permease [Chloroflexi bacterium]|nr:ABC transporter permease [Chloroflexota bacterium]
MIQLIKMAYRDLGRNRRRSFFSALALGIGLALLLLMAAVMQGEMRGSMDMSIKLQSGHLQVRSVNYDPDKSSLAWEDLVENPEQVAAQISTLAPVKAATPRLIASGIVSVADETAGVTIMGIDPASEASAPYRDSLVGGEYISADDREGVLMGKKLADVLGLAVGDSISLMANTANGDIDEQNFTVRGLYATGSPFYDQTTLILPLSKAQAITQTENRASHIFVLLTNRDMTEPVAAALQSHQLEVVTWRTMNAMITQVEQMSSGFMVLIYLIVLGITATVIVNTLVMAVFERTREIGILAAIGMRGSRIMAMFFAESTLLAVGGILIGMILGGIMVAYATYVGFYIGDFGIEGLLIGDRIYAYLTVTDAVTLVITAFVVSLLAALYPALLASRMEPVVALHTGE